VAELRGPAEVVVGIARRLRRRGLSASPDRVHLWVRALDALDPLSTDDVARAGRLTMCATREEQALFDEVLAAYLAEQRLDPGAQLLTVPSELVVVELGELDDGAGGEVDDEELAVPTASRIERLAATDLAELPSLDAELLALLLRAFSGSGRTRRGARRRPARRGRADPAATLRRVLAAGGELTEVARADRRPKPRRLVLLLDLSGSMAAYEEGLLSFAYAAGRQRRPTTEVFTIGTRLTRVTDHLVGADVGRAVAAASAAAVDRGGGTRLGELVKAFSDRFGQRGLARGAVVAVFSDGWERGDPALLGEQMARLQRLAHRVVWANPRKAQPGYEPLAAGMAAALPHVDEFVEGHSVAALVELAGVLLGATDRTSARRPLRA